LPTDLKIWTVISVTS